MLSSYSLFDASGVVSNQSLSESFNIYARIIKKLKKRTTNPNFIKIINTSISADEKKSLLHSIGLTQWGAAAAALRTSDRRQSLMKRSTGRRRWWSTFGRRGARPRSRWIKCSPISPPTSLKPSSSGFVSPFPFSLFSSFACCVFPLCCNF